jgi:SET domain-containing protein
MSNWYFLHHSGSDVIDGCAKGCIARFINHSCDPNCVIEKWFVPLPLSS